MTGRRFKYVNWQYHRNTDDEDDEDDEDDDMVRMMMTLMMIKAEVMMKIEAVTALDCRST